MSCQLTSLCNTSFVASCCFIIHFAIEGHESIVANTLDGMAVRFVDVYWNNTDCDRYAHMFT